MYSEKTLRRKAEKIGYIIDKGYVRFLIDVEGSPVYHDENGEKVTGYHIVSFSNFAVAGFNSVFDHQLSLEEVEEVLKSEYEERGLKF